MSIPDGAEGTEGAETFLHAHIGVDHPGISIDVRISAAAREIVGLVGPNGAGKTTVLRAIAGLQPIDRGLVSIRGTVVDDPVRDVLVAPQARRVGVVFQDYRLFPHLSALDNIAFGLRCRSRSRAEARRVAADWLDRFDLGSHRNHRPGALSGGQAQRVALARALATTPDILLLDEPLAAIDPEWRARIGDDLRRHLATFDGVTIVVSHQYDEIRALAGRVVVLDGGQVSWSGPSADLR